MLISDDRKNIYMCLSYRPSRVKLAELRLSDVFRKLYSLLFGKPSNFSEFSDGLFASGLVYGSRAVNWIKRKGIGFVLNLTEYDLSYDGIESAHVKMINGLGQPPELVHEAVLLLDKKLSEGKKVLVHCSAGKGRTGIVLSCYLVYKNKLNAEKALDIVRKTRKGSLSDKAQADCVFLYESWLKKNVGGND